MPEMWVTVEWPDGTSDVCYSPSTIVEKYLTQGVRYPMGDFLARAREAWRLASDRVEAKFGARCTSADEQLRVIERSLARFERAAAKDVTILRIARSPP